MRNQSELWARKFINGTNLKNVYQSRL
jgi:hypothetical protein